MHRVFPLGEGDSQQTGTAEDESERDEGQRMCNLEQFFLAAATGRTQENKVLAVEVGVALETCSTGVIARLCADSRSAPSTEQERWVPVLTKTTPLDYPTVVRVEIVLNRHLHVPRCTPPSALRVACQLLTQRMKGLFPWLQALR